MLIVRNLLAAVCQCAVRQCLCVRVRWSIMEGSYVCKCLHVRVCVCARLMDSDQSGQIGAVKMLAVLQKTGFDTTLKEVFLVVSVCVCVCKTVCLYSVGHELCHKV